MYSYIHICDGDQLWRYALDWLDVASRVSVSGAISLPSRGAPSTFTRSSDKERGQRLKYDASCSLARSPSKTSCREGSCTTLPRSRRPLLSLRASARCTAFGRTDS